MRGDLVRHHVTKDWGILLGMSTLHPDMYKVQWFTNYWGQTVPSTEEPKSDIQFVSSAGQTFNKREVIDE